MSRRTGRCIHRTWIWKELLWLTHYDKLFSQGLGMFDIACCAQCISNAVVADVYPFHHTFGNIQNSWIRLRRKKASQAARFSQKVHLDLPERLSINLSIDPIHFDDIQCIKHKDAFWFDDNHCEKSCNGDKLQHFKVVESPYNTSQPL